MMISPLFTTRESGPIKITAEPGAGPEQLISYASSNSQLLDQLLRDHGAILFRGFGLREAQDMSRCAEGLGAEPYGYTGGNSPRSQVAADVFTSTDYPASEEISLHNEMSYLPNWPARLFFFCAVAPVSGGQTSLANSHEVLASVSPLTVEALQSRKLKYIRNFTNSPLGKTWQTTYGSQDRAQVQEIICSQGSECTWGADDALQVSTVCEPTVEHPVTGKQAWFNQAEQWHPSAFAPKRRALLEKAFSVDGFPHDCAYGDGGALDEVALSEIRDAMRDCKLLFDWQAGDLLMVDNITMMHGREPFKGERRILAYLSRT